MRVERVAHACRRPSPSTGRRARPARAHARRRRCARRRWTRRARRQNVATASFEHALHRQRRRPGSASRQRACRHIRSGVCSGAFQPTAWPARESRAAQEFVRFHRLPAGALQLEKRHRAFATCDGEVVVEHRHPAHLLPFHLCDAGPSRAPGHSRRSARTRRRGMATAREYGCAASFQRSFPSRCASRLVDLVGVGDAFRPVAACSGSAPRSEPASRAYHQVGAQRSKPIVQLACRHIGADGDTFRHADRTGIESLLHAHRP